MKVKNKKNITGKPYPPLIINGIKIPVFLSIERRKGYRCSFINKGLSIRIPTQMNLHQREQIITECIQWALTTIENKPTILRKYKKRKFTTGTIIQLFDGEYKLQIQYADRKSIGGTVNNKQITMILPNQRSVTLEAKHISSVLAKHFKPFLKERLSYWNELFPVQHKTLRLKYNSSNWGSCSSKQNINLSTRLLLCPISVIDYVIVHELAHLIHQNHSKLFWQEVARVLPNYRTQVKWLKEKGAHIDF